MRLLLIGPWTDKSELRLLHIGGARVSFSNLAEQLAEHPGVDVSVFDLGPHYRRFVDLARSVASVFWTLAELARSDVLAFHASNRRVALMGPLYCVIAALWRKRFVVRVFGGSFGKYVNGLPAPLAWPSRWMLRRADSVLVQTRADCAEVQALAGRPVTWFPTTRPAPAAAHVRRRNHARRFVYMGRVMREKGIHDLLDCARRLVGRGITFDLYGPRSDNVTMAELDAAPVTYHGPVRHVDVETVLDQYDVLVLPTYYSGEGYPGAILEAYAIGMPVIATDWRALSELVDDQTGILIPIKSPAALEQAVLTLAEDDARVARLSENALARSRDFLLDAGLCRFLDACGQPQTESPASSPVILSGSSVGDS